MALDKAPLGKTSKYPEHYAPDLLFPVPRDEKRRSLGLADGRWPWFGGDLWQAWEISWLNHDGLPRVAWGEIEFPCASPAIIESKSLKLYLNSFNQTVFSSPEQVREVMVRDLSSACGAAVTVRLYDVEDAAGGICGRPKDYCLIDNQPLRQPRFDYHADCLNAGDEVVSERLCSHLLKSNCPVTGQPDWATLLVDYSGPAIDHAGLLEYVVGFRNKQDFHEHCVETVFTDLLEYCRPEALTVVARYTRRGGLDINPWRSTSVKAGPGWRTVRQ
ncbi:MAG TPA: NADPH-dependent 7-cyano-7-deazaguanine reductase QueF [Marinobacter sp.]|jgi:7-cyano-7-deazaguanine reductase|nr:NADPH-dependent 7-cyano-7-deazaguanine reductase QueF [Marinobacter sp.]